MICETCEQLGKDACSVFTQTERLQMLAAQISMMQSIENGRKDPNDLKIANSIITKLMLGFDPPSRRKLQETFLQSARVDIELKNCPHHKIIAVT
jgi:hypothetical protein